MERQLDPQRRRSRRDAARHAPLCAGRRGRQPLGRPPRAARVLRADQAFAQQPARRRRRRRQIGGERARALRERPHRQRPPPGAAAGRGGHRPPPRPADGRPGRGCEGRGCHRDLALPHRRRRSGRGGATRLELPRPLRNPRRWLRLLAPRLRLGRAGSRPGRGDAALDRPALAEEPGARRLDRRPASSARSGSARTAWRRSTPLPAPTEPRRASRAAPRSSRTPRSPRERASSPRSRAGTGSRTTRACSSASGATSAMGPPPRPRRPGDRRRLRRPRGRRSLA